MTLLVFVLPLRGYCQTAKLRVNVPQVYREEAERLLLPAKSPGSGSKLVAAYLVHPMGDPDYSLCLIDSSRHFLMELRLLDKNLWAELLTGFMQKRSLTASVTACKYSMAISKRFKKKMIRAFDRVNPVRKYTLDPGIVENYDGTGYEFRWVEKGEMKKKGIHFTIREDCYESGFIRLLDRMAADMKNNTFKEEGFFNQLR